VSDFEDILARAVLAEAPMPEDLIAQIRDTLKTIEGLARGLRQVAALLEEKSRYPSQG
jgi:hypothetical protein